MEMQMSGISEIDNSIYGIFQGYELEYVLDSVAIISLCQFNSDKDMANSKDMSISQPTITKYKEQGIYYSGYNYKLCMIEYLSRFNANRALSFAKKYNIDGNDSENISDNNLSLITRMPLSVINAIKSSHSREALTQYYEILKRQPARSLYYQFLFLNRNVFGIQMPYNLIKKQICNKINEGYDDGESSAENPYALKRPKII